MPNPRVKYIGQCSGGKCLFLVLSFGVEWWIVESWSAAYMLAVGSVLGYFTHPIGDMLFGEFGVKP